jgi:hypothetical protein
MYDLTTVSNLFSYRAHHFIEYRLPTFGSDTEEWHFSDDQEDLYFKSLVDNFVSAVGDVYKSMLPEDTICKEADNQLQSNRYAMSALKHYNNSEDNKVKFSLFCFHVHKHLEACSWFTIKCLIFVALNC